jgi:hypothetical protein
MLVMADLKFRRPVRQCSCEDCGNHPQGDVGLDHQAINRVMALLDERQRRLFAAMLALRRGHGGIQALSVITGLSRTTIRLGIADLRRGVVAVGDRIRRPGGGRQRLEKKIPPS